MKNVNLKPNPIGRRYFTWKHLLLQAFLSAFIIVFYTTKKSLLESIHNPAHLVVFGFSFVAMILVCLGIASITRVLDRYYSWTDHTLLRSILQFFFGVGIVALLSINVLYFFAWEVMDINLWETEYFSRDFTIFMACVLVINLHHQILALRFNYRHLKKQITSFSSLTPEQKLFHEETIEKEFAYEFHVNELTKPLLACRVSVVKIDDQNGRIVNVIDHNGNVYTLENPLSLIKIHSYISKLFIKISRASLLNKYDFNTAEINKISDDEVELKLFNNYSFKMSNRKYKNLVFRAEELIRC